VLQKIEHVCRSVSLDDQGIHLALEVKTSFSNFTPAMGSSTESNAYKPLSASPERRREHAHKKLQSKAWATTLNKTDPS
jgi:hypothetical protein